jgi:SAM-dependent methyltransferase
MSRLSEQDPLGRFTGLAEVYARHRPGYPAAAVDFIVGRCNLDERSLLADVGCGTGISTRLFVARGIPVVGIEPNDEMRRRAEAETLPPGLPVPSYRAGRAEATGLCAGAAGAVLAAQAFHWFDPGAALAEFHRILEPGGWVALVWNERDESDPCTAEVGAAIRTAPGAAAVEGPRAQAGLVLRASPLFEQTGCEVFANEQELDEEGLLGRVFSASYAPREPAAAAELARLLGEAFARHQRAGRVVLRYRTSVHSARRRDRAGA